MMVWDDDDMSDDEDEKYIDDGDGSIASFAFEECDLDAEFANKERLQTEIARDDTVSATEQSDFFDETSNYDNSLSDISGLDSVGDSETDSFYDINPQNRLV